MVIGVFSSSIASCSIAWKPSQNSGCVGFLNREIAISCLDFFGIFFSPIGVLLLFVINASTSMSFRESCALAGPVDTLLKLLPNFWLGGAILQETWDKP